MRSVSSSLCANRGGERERRKKRKRERGIKFRFRIISVEIQQFAIQISGSIICFFFFFRKLNFPPIETKKCRRAENYEFFNFVKLSSYRSISIETIIQRLYRLVLLLRVIFTFLHPMMDDLRLEWTKISKNYKELGVD